MLELVCDGKTIWAQDPETVEKLEKNFFGAKQGPRILLRPEEALYIITFQNGVCKDVSESILTFSQLCQAFGGDKRLFIKYSSYRDWRDRGLVLARTEDTDLKPRKSQGFRKYPSKELKAREPVEVEWQPGSLFGVVEDNTAGKALFEKYWLGQYGVYKQDRGELLKLDVFEVIFLAKHFGSKVLEDGKHIGWEALLKQLISSREYANQLWDVYEDWRLRGYVVKSGFKFGSHFRIYFPGATPAAGGSGGADWMHSKHVLHVFPKEQKLLISEWARAVRVAHGVKKTFLLGIPELTDKDLVDYPAEFVAYRRKKVGQNWIRETTEDKPRYLMASVSEDEHIGGIELASLLKKAERLGLELLLSIVDRETSITYYVLKKVILPGSPYEYYEIEWMKP